MEVEKLWGSRFSNEPDEETLAFIAGRDVYGPKPADERLIPFDIWGSRAHCVMLASQQIIDRESAKKILSGLLEIESLWKKGKFKLEPKKEDVHSNIESYLTEKYGIGVAGKLHTGRSRNDQVVTDIKLCLREQCLFYVEHLCQLIEELSQKAAQHTQTVMPGFTHHQHAMVTTFGHVLLSFAVALIRDLERFQNWWKMFNKNPLGSAVGYGTSFALDRKMTIDFLGFDEIEKSSLDPMTTRGEAETEFAYTISVLLNHLSSLAQTLIIFSTPEFGFVTIADEFCGGSSIMPQKKNPSTLEVIKAKAALSHGSVISLLSLGKASFIGYNKDTQWSKYIVFDLIDETFIAVRIMTRIIETLNIQKNKMYEQAKKDFVTTVDLVEALVTKKSLPFRLAKILVEKSVKYSELEGSEKVTLEALKKAQKELSLDFEITEKELKKFQNPKVAVQKKNLQGGPSSFAVQKAVKAVNKELDLCKSWLKEKQDQIKKAKDLLETKTKEVING